MEDKNTQLTPVFDIDASDSKPSDVPTISTLMMRKKLDGSVGYDDEIPAIENLTEENPSTNIVKNDLNSFNSVLSEAPNNATSRIEPSVDLTPPRAASMNPVKTDAPPQILARKRNRSTQTIPQLISWKPEELKNSPHPLEQAACDLLDASAKGMLYLAPRPPRAGAKFPDFCAAAAVGLPDRVPLWTGLVWSPEVVLEMWAHFRKFGSIELPPPGTQTILSSHRNLIRSTFGVGGDEWLSLIQVGEGNAWRGFLAVVSNNSMSAAIERAVPFLKATVQQKAA